VRDLIVDERRHGRTIFFSTHILSDVETLCDEVSILREGKVVVSGRLDQLLNRDVQRSDVVLKGASEELVRSLESQGHRTRRAGDSLIVETEGEGGVKSVLEASLGAGAGVFEVTPRNETLEDLFLREAILKPSIKPNA
jgi:ABC-2 type transport system ATP-binding protein